MTETVMLWFDDEHAGGESAWSETTLPGCIPRPTDLVYHDAKQWIVDQIAWGFVRPGSIMAREGKWVPSIRVHVSEYTPGVPSDSTSPGGQ